MHKYILTAHSVSYIIIRVGVYRVQNQTFRKTMSRIRDALFYELISLAINENFYGQHADF